MAYVRDNVGKSWADSPFTLPTKIATLLPKKYASLLSKPVQAPQSHLLTIKRRRRALGVWSSAINPQKSSPFLSQLPAEIRNEIYEYVFTSNTPFSVNPWHHPHDWTNHPLSLLLTCRLINSEAVILAFHSHTFHLSGDISFHGLRLRTTHLPNALFDSISSVSCMPWPYWQIKGDRKSLVYVLSDILLLFPHVRSVAVKAILDGRQCEAWMKAALDGVLQRDLGRWRLIDALAGEVDDGHAAASTRMLCWLTSRTGEASVHVGEDEESGRRVRVRFEGGGRVDMDAPGINWDSPGLGRLGLRLKEVARCEDVREVKTRTGEGGFEFDPGEEYWADLRNRKMVEKRGEVDRGRDEELPGV